MHSWPTQSTNPRQFAYIHAPCHIGRKVLIKHSRDIILGCLRSANPVSLLLSIRHARLHSCPDDGQLQLCEHSRHLNEGLAHGVNVALATVNGDASHNLQAHMLALDDVDNLTELLCASG